MWKMNILQNGVLKVWRNYKMIIDPFLEKPDYIMSDREKELEARYAAFQEWLDKCPLVVTDYKDYTDEFQITLSLEAD